jgi:hypothetical protein
MQGNRYSFNKLVKSLPPCISFDFLKCNVIGWYEWVVITCNVVHFVDHDVVANKISTLKCAIKWSDRNTILIFLSKICMSHHSVLFILG